MKYKKNIAKLALVLVVFAFLREASPADAPAASAVTAKPDVSAADAVTAKPDVSAESAIVVDADDMSPIYEKNADQRRAMASTTKLMTLLLAVEKGDMDEIITVPGSASTVPADSTRVPVYPGQNMPFRDLVYSMMIKSGNDAANAIGTLLSGNVESFVSLMNARAGSMGLKNTRFKNPHGYPLEGHYSSSRDMAAIMAAVARDGRAMRVLKARSYSMADGRALKNGYAILDPDSEYYCEYVLGGKTGYSLSSGQCFACVAKKGGRTLISVVLYSGLGKADKWKDTKALLEYAFDGI